MDTIALDISSLIGTLGSTHYKGPTYTRGSSTLPRNRRHGNVNGSSATAVKESEENTPVSTATATPENDVDQSETDTQFEFHSEPAPEDFSPDRKAPGRVRKPSYFDKILRSKDVFEKGWQRVPANSEEHKAAILRELNRAKLYLNKEAEGTDTPEIGLDLDTSQDDAVYYKSRVAQKRERKAKDEDALAENEAADGVDVDSEDRDA